MSTIDTTGVAPPHEESPKRLRRSRENRMLAGVAGGLADYFGLHPAVYRVLFVALTLAGGSGLLLYLAAAAVMPAEGADESFLEEKLRRNRDRPWLVIGLALLALAVIWSLSDPWAGVGVAPATVAIALVLGSAIVVWTRASRRDERRSEARGSRSISWRTTTVVAIVVALLGAASAAAAVAAHVGGGIGERHERPASVAALSDEYELGFGALELDLTRVDLPRGETRVSASVGLGELEVEVPEDVAVRVVGDVRWGESNVLGRHESGSDLRERFADGGFDEASRRLVLELEVWGGELRVVR